MSDENNTFDNQQSGEQGNLNPQSTYNGNAGNGNYGSNQSKGFGIASMVCGILALVTCCMWCTCIPLAVVSIVLGILQIRKSDSKGMAIAGIVCSVIALVLFIGLTVYGNYLESSGFLKEYYDMLESYGYTH